MVVFETGRLCRSAVVGSYFRRLPWRFLGAVLRRTARLGRLGSGIHALPCIRATFGSLEASQRRVWSETIRSTQPTVTIGFLHGPASSKYCTCSRVIL